MVHIAFAVMMSFLGQMLTDYSEEPAESWRLLSFSRADRSYGSAIYQFIGIGEQLCYVRTQGRKGFDLDQLINNKKFYITNLNFSGLCVEGSRPHILIINSLSKFILKIVGVFFMHDLRFFSAHSLGLGLSVAFVLYIAFC
jgi:hypothetical protein